MPLAEPWGVAALRCLLFCVATAGLTRAERSLGGDEGRLEQADQRAFDLSSGALVGSFVEVSRVDPLQNEELPVQVINADHSRMGIAYEQKVTTPVKYAVFWMSRFQQGGERGSRYDMEAELLKKKQLCDRTFKDRYYCEDVEATKLALPGNTERDLHDAQKDLTYLNQALGTHRDNERYWRSGYHEQDRLWWCSEIYKGLDGTSPKPEGWNGIKATWDGYVKNLRYNQNFIDAIAAIEKKSHSSARTELKEYEAAALVWAARADRKFPYVRGGNAEEINRRAREAETALATLRRRVRETYDGPYDVYVTTFLGRERLTRLGGDTTGNDIRGKLASQLKLDNTRRDTLVISFTKGDGEKHELRNTEKLKEVGYHYGLPMEAAWTGDGPDMTEMDEAREKLQDETKAKLEKVEAENEKVLKVLKGDPEGDGAGKDVIATLQERFKNGVESKILQPHEYNKGSLTARLGLEFNTAQTVLTKAHDDWDGVR